MADRIDDSGDLAVAELRRKARRRLVGAIVLALAAAILLPLLLEKEPRSLGDEVSIQIPPVDNGRFVSRLTPDKAKEAPPEPKAAVKSADMSTPAPATQPAPAPMEATALPPAVAGGRISPAPPKAASAEPSTRPITAAPAGVADAGARVEAPAPAAPSAAPASPPAATSSAPPPTAPPSSPPSAAPPPTPAVTPAATPVETPQSPASGASQPVAATAPAAPASDPAAASGKPEGFIIQLAAFTDDKGANSFANKIRNLGYPAYTEPVETKSRGKLWRVRVGGYPTRAAAQEALSKLKAEGHDGLVSAAK